MDNHLLVQIPYYLLSHYKEFIFKIQNSERERDKLTGFSAPNSFKLKGQTAIKKIRGERKDCSPGEVSVGAREPQPVEYEFQKRAIYSGT